VEVILKENMTDKDVKRLLKEFGAKNEEELVDIMQNSWNSAICQKCGRKIDLLNCDYENDDPVCKGGCIG
jgi:hypothetical protein